MDEHVARNLEGRLIGIIANHVRYHAGKLTSADLNSYN